MHRHGNTSTKTRLGKNMMTPVDTLQLPPFIIK